MKCKKSIAVISALLYCLAGICQQVYVIPKQTFQPYKILGLSERDYGIGYEADTAKINFKMSIDSFEISSQVTFKQYNLYLESVKKDSTYNFYVSQLPDSNITSKENYKAYISDKKYDVFPVAGISWEAAMNYCKWRTTQENKGTDFKFIYRLPKVSEWLAAYNLLKENDTPNDFNKNFSDWTMGLYFEGSYNFKVWSSFVYDVVYLQKPGDHDRDKRKRVIGDSYLFQREKLINHSSGYYAFSGYRQIAFRLVKEEIKNNDDSKSLHKNVLAYWGIEMNK